MSGAPALGRLAGLVYAAPMVPVWMLHAPALSILPALYAKHAGISLATLGAILLFTRLLDAVTDPLIGYLSDRTRGLAGRRKPWIVAGWLLATVSCYFWFRPEAQVTAEHFLIWSIGVYVGWTLIEIPHSAWLADLTRDYDQRSRLAASRAAAVYLGYILFFCAPLLPLFATSEITPQVTAAVSWVIIGLLAVTVPLLLAVLPSGQAAEASRPRFGDTVRGVWRNRPFHVFFACMLAGHVSSGMVGGLYFFFMDTYLGIADKIAFVALGTSLVSLASTRLWPPLMARLGKHRVIAVSVFGTVATLVGMAMIPPGALAFPLMMIVFGCSAVTSTGLMVATTALMADVVDYDEWKTGRNNAASYYAFNALVNKFGFAVGGGLSLLIAGIFGFDPQASNGPAAMAGFFTAFILVPIVLNLTSLGLALRFPLDRRRHDIIARRLAARHRRSVAAHAGGSGADGEERLVTLQRELSGG